MRKNGKKVFKTETQETTTTATTDWKRNGNGTAMDRNVRCHHRNVGDPRREAAVEVQWRTQQ